MTETLTDHTLTLTRVFAAPRAAVWAAWTDRDRIAAWLGPPDTVSEVDAWDFRISGRYHLVMHAEDDHPVGGTFLEIVEGERLAMTWTWEHGVLDGIEMLVELDFRDVEAGTELTLTHTKLPTETAREKHAGGWAACLDELARHVGA